MWLAGVPLTETLAGRAAQERSIEFIPDLSQYQNQENQRAHKIGKYFCSYLAVPLEAKGELKGILQLFHRDLLDPDPDWFGFLQALADQAAIAIDSAQLFQALKYTNRDLVDAYDKTIEGWARALDLRDKETEGHSQRVTDLTLDLARRMGVEEEQLVHIRRGARLHDIGKMGVPDEILLKPGPLNEVEWQIMRQHATSALDLLYPIDFLGPALEIPYSHHEKWDGTGYPQGLKELEIPLSARIFAVIDVWDALTHDRPYRKAWAPPEVLAYIREQSGKHFDPQVVTEFLALVGRSPNVLL
jgi:putative nucleotidyltransferase with HDIG domain